MAHRRLYREKGNTRYANDVGERLAHYESELLFSNQPYTCTASATAYAGSILYANRFLVRRRSRSNLRHENPVEFHIGQAKLAPIIN